MKEFLGPAPSGFDKIKGGDGSFKNRGALDIDTNMESSVGLGGTFLPNKYRWKSPQENMMEQGETTLAPPVAAPSQQSQMQEFIERTKYIPIRLTFSQRKLLRMCEATLNVSEYTDKVDILTWKSKTGRIHEQIRDICAILSGLAVAADYEVCCSEIF